VPSAGETRQLHRLGLQINGLVPTWAVFTERGSAPSSRRRRPGAALGRNGCSSRSETCSERIAGCAQRAHGPCRAEFTATLWGGNCFAIGLRARVARPGSFGPGGAWSSIPRVFAGDREVDLADGALFRRVPRALLQRLLSRMALRPWPLAKRATLLQPCIHLLNPPILAVVTWNRREAGLGA